MHTLQIRRKVGRAGSTTDVVGVRDYAIAIRTAQAIVKGDHRVDDVIVYDPNGTEVWRSSMWPGTEVVRDQFPRHLTGPLPKVVDR